MSDPLYIDMIEKLQRHSEEILKSQERVLISVVGKGGTGKSHFGKYLRNNGFGKFKQSSITIIDDKKMWIDFLYFFRRSVRISYSGVDELRPILEKLPVRKKIIFYINATPLKRITRTDILLKLYTDEETRFKRLQGRYANNPGMFRLALESDNIIDGIKYRYMVEANV